MLVKDHHVLNYRISAFEIVTFFFQQDGLNRDAQCSPKYASIVGFDTALTASDWLLSISTQ
jgi:hypothetical protein